MKVFFKLLIWIAGICAGIYLSVCGFLYFKQDAIIFPGTRLPTAYKLKFEIPFHEYAIKTNGGNILRIIAMKYTMPATGEVNRNIQGKRYHDTKPLNNEI